MHRRFLVILVLLALAAVPAFANHSWGNYHWARQSNPFTLKLYDNLSSQWEGHLQTAVNDWNRSTVFDFQIVWQSPLTSTKKCGSAAGVIEVCNDLYGQRGWLGIAGISISGSHITKGYTKLNDTYFNMPQYNTSAWRQMVTCQEIAHDIGLDHQDEDFGNANLGSCMDYTNDPDGGAGGGSSNDPSNVGPNQHDFDQIASIYAHLDSTTTIAAVFNAMAMEASIPRTDEAIFSRDIDDLGVAISWDREGRPDTFFKAMSLSNEGVNGDVTHIYWVPGDPRAHHHD